MAAALAFGEEMLVSPLGALVMVFNIPFARCFLKESASLWDIVGSVFIMAGVAMVAVFGPETSNKPSPQQLDDLLVKVPFLIVGSFLVVFTIVYALVAHFVTKKLLLERAAETADDDINVTLRQPIIGEGEEGDEASVEDDKKKSLQLPLNSVRTYFLFLGYAMLMAICTGMLMCSASILETLVIDAVNNKTGPSLATNALFWGAVVWLVVFLVLQSKFANNGLRVRARGPCRET